MKRYVIITVLISTLFLSGCAMWEHDYTEEDEDVLAVYTSDLLLQYDDSYTEGLLDREDLITLTPVPTEVPATVTPTIAPTDATQDTSAGEDTTNADTEEGTGNTVANTELSEILGINTLETTYLGYELYESFAIGESSRIEPSNNRNQLLIVTLSLQNNSDQQQTVSISQAGLTYRMDVNNGTFYEPSPSIMMNDFQNLDVVIEPLTSQEAVLVFEVPKEFSPETINLFMMKDSQTVIFKMK